MTLEELLVMARTTGGIPLEAATPSLRKYELEKYLDSHGWPWNEMLSRELDRIIQRMGARDEPSFH